MGDRPCAFFLEPARIHNIRPIGLGLVCLPIDQRRRMLFFSLLVYLQVPSGMGFVSVFPIWGPALSRQKTKKTLSGVYL